MIYFDNAATTKPCEAAVEAAARNMRECFGNPSSLHGLGIEAEKVITSAKETILSELGKEGEIYFTSGATESNNTAIRGAVFAYRRNGNKIVTTTIEHPSVARVMDKLEEDGYEVVRVAPKDYREDFEQAIIQAVDDKTILVSTMLVNNETGFITDTQRIYSAVKAKNPKCIMHVDAVQGFPKVSKKLIGGDFITMSAHKIHGIKGLGVLYAAKGARFAPLVYGGGQQNNLRSGTEPVDLIAAYAAAVKAYPKDLSIFDRLYEHLTEKLAEIDGITINSYNNLKSICNFSVGGKGVRSEILLHALEEKGIYVSSGSACSKGKKSAVLAQFGVDDKAIDGALRISFSPENTIEETDIFIEELKNCIARFRR